MEEVTYQKCLDAIEQIRAERVSIYTQIEKLRSQGNHTAEIASLYEKDEQLGADMHAWTIKRNLLEP